jgi:GxxExxY protein
MDVLVEDRIVVEAKALEMIAPVHDAQLLTYLRLDHRRVGLLINFRNALLRNGIVRRILDPVEDRPKPLTDLVGGDARSPDISADIIAAAIEVHRELGPGLLRSAYVESLCRDLSLRKLRYCRSVPVPLNFLGRQLGKSGAFDLSIEGFPIQVLAVNELTEIHALGLGSLIRQAGLPAGLLLNFNCVLLKDGIRRCFSSPRPPSSAVQS